MLSITTLCLDFDNTFTADKDMWREIVPIMQKYGHNVICISAADDCDTERRLREQELPPGVPVYLSSATPKKKWAADNGINVDIWIDDCPEMIVYDAVLGALCESINSLTQQRDVARHELKTLRALANTRS